MHPAALRDKATPRSRYAGAPDTLILPRPSRQDPETRRLCRVAGGLSRLVKLERFLRESGRPGEASVIALALDDVDAATQLDAIRAALQRRYWQGIQARAWALGELDGLGRVIAATTDAIDGITAPS